MKKGDVSIGCAVFLAGVLVHGVALAGGMGSSCRSGSGPPCDRDLACVNNLCICGSDVACDDGRYCNGFERCRPGGPGAPASGCVAAERGPCGSGQTCDDVSDRCVNPCDTQDADGDGSHPISCGGDDCDDNDRNRFPGNAEVCDAIDHDEDCDPRTFGDRDADGDGHIDAQCGNWGD